jgi:hypothetical protein
MGINTSFTSRIVRFERRVGAESSLQADFLALDVTIITGGVADGWGNGAVSFGELALLGIPGKQVADFPHS